MVILSLKQDQITDAFSSGQSPTAGFARVLAGHQPVSVSAQRDFHANREVVAITDKDHVLFAVYLALDQSPIVELASNLASSRKNRLLGHLLGFSIGQAYGLHQLVVASLGPFDFPEFLGPFAGNALKMDAFRILGTHLFEDFSAQTQFLGQFSLIHGAIIIQKKPLHARAKLSP